VSTNMEKQLASAGKVIGSAIDQLDLDKRLSAVEKRLGGVADKVGMAEQRTLLGIPVSRKRPDWSRIATVGAVAVGALAAGVRFLSGNGDGADGESGGDGGSDGGGSASSDASADEPQHTAKDWKQEGEDA
jgi:hypothetical protein